MTEEVLLEEVGPNGNVQAIVEVAHGSMYLYLWSNPETEVPLKTVWVRNISPAPESLNTADMKEEGIPPLNPARFCRHPEGMAPPAADDLRVVWLPEGNGIALFEVDEILAIIPPWSGVNGFEGYARDQIGEGPVAWELKSSNVLIDRFQAAQAYWDAWHTGALWEINRDLLMNQVEAAFGQYSNYYAIDGGCWPPKALVRIPHEKGTILLTLGVSLRPQPNVELYVKDSAPYRRIELGVILPKTWSDDEVTKFASNLSANANYPWSTYTWFGPRHTIQCPSWRNSQFNMALLLNDHPEIGTLSLGPIMNDPVQVLWYLPISEAEQQAAIDDSGRHALDHLPQNRWQDA